MGSFRNNTSFDILSWDGDKARWYCVNSTGVSLLRGYTSDARIYEEAMWWNMSFSNTTLTGLSNGNHNVTIYANDTLGNMGQSQVINFTILADTCDCPGDSSAHEFDCADECDVSTCIAGDVTFTGVGYINCSGVWDVDSLGDPGDGCTLWINSACDIDE